MIVLWIMLGFPLAALGVGLIWLGTRCRNGSNWLLGRVDQRMSEWDADATRAQK